MKQKSLLSKVISTLISFVLLSVLGFTGLLLAAAAPQTEMVFAVGPVAPSVFPNDPSISYSLTSIISSGLTQPVFVTHAKDARLFVLEQGGKIKIWQSNALLSTAFLDISTTVQTSSEEGLLGLAFEPNYASTGRFYVYYTNKNGDENIARYTVSTGNPNLADALSATILMTISHPTNGNHNGGWLGFGPDNFLYAAVGDGGAGGDPFCAAQNTSDRRGKLLRLNVAGQLSYTTPATNTFTTTQLSEVWAIGLRNPWRNSFDRQTGDLYIGDVGQGAWEEVNFVPASSAAGLNFGWSQREGRNAYSSGCPSSNISATEPFTDYAHNANGGNSVTGGYVYRGGSYPWLNGAYFFGDYSSGNLWTAWQPGAPGIFSTAKITSVGFNISSFGEDSAGEIYLVDYAGRVLRLSSTQSTPSTSTPTPTKTNTPIPTPTLTPSSTSINTPTPTKTNTPSPTPTNTPTTPQPSTQTPTPTPTKTNTPTTPQPSTQTPTKTNTPVVSVTQTQIPTQTLTPAPTVPTPLATTTNTPAPPPSSTPTITQTGLSDLKISEMRFSIQLDGSGCYSSKRIGTYVSVQNSGFAATGPFSVTFDGSFMLRVAGGLQAGQSTLLWFDSYPIQASATADSGNEVTESDENNNTLTQLLPIPTPPLTCKTATPGPTQPPTVTPIPTIKITPGLILPRVSLPLVLADLVVKR